MQRSNKKMDSAANDTFYSLNQSYQYDSIDRIKIKNSVTLNQSRNKKSTKISDLALDLLNSKMGISSSQSIRILESRLNKWIIPYFNNKSIQEIGFCEISEFVNLLKTNHYKTPTISQYLNVLKQLFKIAIRNDLIFKIPEFPKFKQKSVPRGGFTVIEYLLLVRKAKELSKLIITDKQISHRSTRNNVYAMNKFPLEMAWVIRFMVNSFVRPVDIKVLKHKHLSVIKKEYCYLRLNLPETKSHNTPIVTLNPAVHIYESLCKYHAKENCINPNDYVFFPKILDREIAIFLIGKYFRLILTSLDLRMGSLGQFRTLYSLRHTAITFRLLYGTNIDLLTLAKNARTNVEMIERFYASNLSPEMNIDLILGRRK